MTRKINCLSTNRIICPTNKTRQQVSYLLDHYSPSRVSQQVTQDYGNSFAQRGGAGGEGRNGDSYDKKYWKDKECYKCGKKGHPASHCRGPPKNTDKDDDDKSRSSKSSKSSSSSKSRIGKLQKDLKKKKRLLLHYRLRLKSWKRTQTFRIVKRVVHLICFSSLTWCVRAQE